MSNTDDVDAVRAAIADGVAPVRFREPEQLSLGSAHADLELVGDYRGGDRSGVCDRIITFLRSIEKYEHDGTWAIMDYAAAWTGDHEFPFDCGLLKVGQLWVIYFLGSELHRVGPNHYRESDSGERRVAVYMTEALGKAAFQSIDDANTAHRLGIDS